jgi:hypothetical protein
MYESTAVHHGESPKKLHLMTAAEFLQREQERTYSEIGQPPVNFRALAARDWEALNSELLRRQRPRSPLEKALGYDEVRAGFARFAAVNLPTPYENPFVYSMMTAMAKDIEEAAVTLFSHELKTRPLMGTLPLGKAGASAIRIPFTGELIIVIHQGLFAFVNLLGKVVAAAIPSAGSTERGTFDYALDQVDKTIEDNPVILERFIDILKSYLIEGRPHTRGQYVLVQPNRTWCVILLQSAELFVLGHEYGHIIKGHFDQQGLQTPSVGSAPIAEILLSWAQEFEADVTGASLAVTAMKRRDYELAFGYSGADFFCTAADIVMRALGVLQRGTEDAPESETHPPWLDRRTTLRRALELGVGAANARIPLYVATTVDHILTTLWAAARPDVVALRDTGAKTSAIWNRRFNSHG